jgi:dolichol kinase
MYRTLPISIIFTIIGLLIITNTLYTKHKKKKSVILDEFLLGFFHIFYGFIYTFYFLRYPQDVANTLFSLINIFVAINFIIILGIVFNEMRNIRKNPELKKIRSFNNFKKKFMADYDKKNRYKRRITHIIPALVIIPIYLIGKSLAPWLPSWEAWSVGLIIAVGTSFVLFFSAGDLLRVARPHLLPDWGKKLFSKGLNKEEVEHNTFTTTSAMILGVSPWLLAGLLIFTIVTLVTSVSDAMAAVTGFRFGKRKFPKWSKKTVEGYIGGILTTFGLASLAFFVLSSLNPLIVLIVSALVAMAFFIVDFSNLPIDDNKINPQAIGLVLLLLVGII